MFKKYIPKTTVMVIAALTIISLTSAITAFAQKEEKEPIDRAVFIHYPKGHENKSDQKENTGKAFDIIKCPNPATCPDYKYSGIRWKLMPVHYVIDPNNADGVSANDIKIAVERGFANWNGAEPNAVFVDDNAASIITGDPTSSRDFVNSVIFRDISAKYPNALAVTFVWYTRVSKAIVEVDTVFNDGFSWAYTDPLTVSSTDKYGNYGSTGLNSYDIGDIATHEQGHWLMLSDLYNSRDSEMTMYGYGAIGELKKISLGLGDKLGIQKIY